MFGVIRHGETHWNRKKKIQGITDIPLAREGILQARCWGLKLGELNWDRILTSDLSRARETAAEINNSLDLPVREDPRLKEQDWGDWTGETVKQLRKSNSKAVAIQEEAGWNFRPPHGESRREVLNRSRQGLMAAADRWPGEKILVVTHNGVLKCLLYWMSARRFLPAEPPLIKPGHLHWIEIMGTRFIPRGINALALASESV
jgi:probable phosphoglycerate mutase